MQFSRSLWLEADDANDCTEGEEVTLMRWGNVIITKLNKDASGRVVSAEGTLNLAGDFKKTKKKLTWVAHTDDTVATSLVEFDFLITKAKIEDGDDFTKFINPHSRAEVRLCVACSAVAYPFERCRVSRARRQEITVCLHVRTVPDASHWRVVVAESEHRRRHPDHASWLVPV